MPERARKSEKQAARATAGGGTRGSGWIGVTPLLRRAPLVSLALRAAVVVALAGCGQGAQGASFDTRERAGATSEAIYSGIADDDGSQNHGVVALKIGDSAQQFELCSASLIAPNVVLTARHCVSQNLTDTVSCDQNGQSG